MYKKMITSFILITTPLPTLNASDLPMEESPRVNLKHGYFLQIVEKLKDVDVEVNTPDVVGFGVHLLNKRGKLKQRWLAVLLRIQEEKRLEGEPLRSVVGREKALFAVPDEYAQKGERVIVCGDGLHVGVIITCKMLLYVTVRDNWGSSVLESDYILLAHGLAHKK